MSVYVDDAEIPYGRMVMCHMIADSREELDRMARLCGIDTRHIQCAGTPREHYDVCKQARGTAIANGANPITQRELARMVRERRRGWAKAQGATK